MKPEENTHKLLARQIQKYLPAWLSDLPEVKAFTAAISSSYQTFERDKEISSHAFAISEKEYQQLYRNLLAENELKKVSIEKLKETLLALKEEGQTEKDFSNDNLLSIADYLKTEVKRRRKAEQSLTDTFQLLTTLVSNFHSGILIKDEHKRVLFLNKEFCSVFSLTQEPDELMGADFSDFPERAKGLFTEPDDFEERTRKISNEHKTLFNDVVYMKNGKVFQRYFIPIYINDEYRGHLWEYSDITDKYNYERELIAITNVQNGILNGTSYSIIYTDTKGLIKLFNKGAEALLGYRSEEMVDKRTPAAFHDSAEVAQRAAELSMESGRNIQPGFEVFVEKAREGAIDTREWTYIHKEGSRFPVMLSVSAVKDAMGGIVGFMGIAHDIRAQKQAESALRKSEKRYREIVEKSSDIVYKTNAAGAFTFVNPAAERLTGYSSEELLQMKYTDLIPSERSGEVMSFYLGQVNQKKLSTYFEFPIKTKDGKEKWVGQSVQLSELTNGSVEFTAMAIDITVRTEYQKTMRLQKEKYESIITNMNLGLLEVDSEERIQYANPSFSNISGYSREELIGYNASDLFMKGNKEIIQKKISQRMRGESDMYEVPVLNKRGELRWWMISGAPNYDEKGNIKGSIGIHLDITEKKKLEKELEIQKEKAEASVKAQATFLANMSHEIRTPLNGIIGMIRELGYEKLQEKQRRYVHNASVASQHLLSVLNNVLDISRIEAGELNLDQHHFLLREVVKDVKSIMSVRAREKGILLGIDLHELNDLVYIGDAGRIRQILLNLVGNSIKFTSQGGVYVDCLIARTNENEHNITFVVEDTGIGMDEAYQKQIFNKFSQEDSSVSRKYGGTGLGMAITYELIQLLKGKIEVKSLKSAGTRIEISFNLPVGDMGELDRLEIGQEQTGDINARVLLVEDNEFNRSVARNMLERFGCKVDEAEDGKAALTLLQKNTYNIILMDLQMPVMDGFETTRVIRNELELKVPIIALTANAFKSELEQCLRLGMDDYVTKPYDEEALLAAIYRLLKMETGSPAPGSPEDAPDEIRETLPDESLYDLSTLIKQGGSHSGYVKKMIAIFMEQTSKVVPELRASYQNKDLLSVYRLTHRIKPSIDGMGITSLKTVVREIEQAAQKQADSPGLKEQLAFLCARLEEVLQQLTKEL